MSLICKNLLTATTVIFLILLSFASISFAAPDLIVLSVDAPSFADTGGTISVPVTFKNQGTDLTNGSYVVCRLIVSPDTAINLGDIYYTEKNILNTDLQAGESASTTFTYTLPSSLQGPYYVGAYVDSTASPTYHIESDENNNANYDPTPLYIGPLQAPTSLDPTSGEDLVGAPYTFSWSAVSGASFYQLKISTQSDFSTTVVNDDQILGSATNYTYLGSLPWGTTHYWQMRTLNSSGTEWGDWSAVQSFVPVQGSTFELLSPASGGAVNNASIAFNWSDIDNIDYYELIVDNNPGLGSPEIHVASLSTSQYEVTNWLSDNTYYWKVVAYLNDGSTVASSVESFHYTLPVWEKPVFVPLYRFYNGSSHDHFYTTNETEKASLIAAGDYTFEKIESYLSDRKFDNSACGYLFRLYNPVLDVHFYTSSESEKDNKIIDGYNYEGIVGFLYTLPGENVVPLQHLEHTTNSDNLYTVNKFEADNVINLGFVPRGIIGYVSSDGLKEPMVHSRPQANFGGVDLASGAYRGLNSLDLKMKGRGPDLSFSHYYNSFGFNHIPMGMGWSHNLSAYITEGIDDSVIVHWGNGTSSRFELEDGSYVDKTGNHDRLNLVDDGSNYGYDLTKKNQTIYEFRRFRAYPFIDLDPENLEVIVLQHVKDWAGNQLTFDYQAETTISDDFGRSLVLSYSANRQLERVTEKVSGITRRSISFTYNASNLLATYTDAEGGITRYTYYDEPATLRHNLLKSITYPENNTVEIDYDQATGQVISIKDANGTDPSEITYAQTTGLTTVTDPAGHIFQFHHDITSARLKRFTDKPNADFNTDADWNVIERTNTDNPNLPTKVTDKRGNVTEYNYDGQGNPLSIINADGMESNYTYTPTTNKLLTHIEFHDPNLAAPPATVYTYDQNDNRLRTITNPEGETVSLGYHATNIDLVEKITDARGPAYKTDFTYDSYGNLKTVTDAEGNLTQYQNDYAGRTTAVIDAKGIKTTHTYDNNNHPLALSNYRSDGVNILRTINRLYDDNGNLETVRWINQGTLSQTQYTYDDRDRLETVVKPGGLTQTLSYYDNDLLHTRQDYNNQTTTYVYDDRNRLHETQYPDGSKVIISRNENGQPTNVTLDKTSGTDLMSVFNYDELNRMESHTDPYGKTVLYAYDEAGRLERLTYPNGNYVDYTYDDAGRIKTVTDWNNGVVTYDYDPAGNLIDIQRSVNGTPTIKTVYTYDMASRLTGIEEKDVTDATLWSYTYDLDEVGNHNSVDAVNEPLTFTPVAQNVSYSNDRTNNRLLSADSTTYTYDNNGNRSTFVTSGVTTTYSWDAENRLTGVSTPSGTSVQHIYDGMGNRIARIEDGTESRYVLDLNGDMSRVLAETDAAGNVTAYYVYGHGLVSRIEPSGDRNFYHFNNRGDTVALSDDTGAITDKYAFDEFGKLMASTGTTDNPFKFVGRFGVMEEGADDYFMRARFYDAGVGKFLSEDPLGFGGGNWNLLLYGSANPIMNIDPNGESPESSVTANSTPSMILDPEKNEEQICAYKEPEWEWFCENGYCYRAKKKVVTSETSARMLLGHAWYRLNANFGAISPYSEEWFGISYLSDPLFEIDYESFIYSPSGEPDIKQM